MSKVKIIHIIVGLNIGGAETMLYKLLKYSNREDFDYEVISLTDKGVFGPKIEELGIPVHSLGMKRGFITFSSLTKARSLVKEAKIIQTWMYHADLIGLIIKTKNQKLFWGIRHSNLERKNNKKLLFIIAKINAFLSKYVDLIISCSKNAADIHTKFGYDPSNMITVPNGFELDTFNDFPYSKNEVEIELKLPKNQPLMVHIGRWNVQKDYPNLIKAISLTKKENDEINFLLCGQGIEESNRELIELIKEYALEQNVYLLGRRDDIPKLLSAADGLISSSLGEGFSNVIGEAMACQTPCIVTDVGDSAYIVDNYGFIVPPGNPGKLAQAILEFVNKPEQEKKAMGRKARERVINEFEINKVVDEFERHYKIK
jgi:glycosyltransferase involved in cell wall biosynthesis